jgi:hypothetical protein
MEIHPGTILRQAAARNVLHTFCGQDCAQALFQLAKSLILKGILALLNLQAAVVKPLSWPRNAAVSMVIRPHKQHKSRPTAFCTPFVDKTVSKPPDTTLSP